MSIEHTDVKQEHVISVDYVGPKSKQGSPEQIDSLRILVSIDRGSKWVFAHMAPNKGLGAHAVDMMNREVRLAGHSRMMLKSDQELPILALLEASKREGA